MADQVIFPEPEHATPEGLLAAGGNLAPETLLAAYRQGIFPWYDRAGGPVLWWSPDPRMVLFPDEFHASRRLKRRIRQSRYQVTEDLVFREVMKECAAPRRGGKGTWIHPEMIDAYVRMHDLGYAHSVEVWDDGQLSGGVYGLHIGRAWFAESMFSRRTDASKIALHYLVKKAKREGWLMIDCQFYTEHLASLGAREISRQEYLKWLDLALDK